VNVLYAVELFFDKPVDDFVRGIWEDLKRNDITSNMASIKELTPHISVGVFNRELPIEQFLIKMEGFNKNQLDVRFDILATFPTTGTVFMGPTITSDLFKLHRDFYKEFQEFNDFAADYYLPNKWNPHCTLAIRLEQQDLIKTFDYCVTKFKPMDARINRIGVVKIEFLNEEWSSKTIFSKSLL
jgi:hypothetical protein